MCGANLLVKIECGAIILTFRYCSQKCRISAIGLAGWNGILTSGSLMGLRATPAESASLCYIAQFCLCECFKSFETTGSTTMKCGTIDHLPGLSDTRGFGMSHGYRIMAIANRSKRMKVQRKNN